MIVRSAHRRRDQGRARTARGRHAAHLHRDGAAGEIRGDDSRGARPASPSVRPPMRTSKRCRSASTCCRSTPSPSRPTSASTRSPNASSATSIPCELWFDFWRNLAQRPARWRSGCRCRCLPSASACGSCCSSSCFNVADRRGDRLCACRPDPVLSTYAIVFEGFMGAVLLLMGALLARPIGSRISNLRSRSIVLASEPALSVLSLILTLPGDQGGLFGYSIQVAGLLGADHRGSRSLYWRAMAIALMPRHPRFWLRSLARCRCCSSAFRSRSGRTSRGGGNRRLRRGDDRNLREPRVRSGARRAADAPRRCARPTSRTSGRA